jgi:hypothetical protein
VKICHQITRDKMETGEVGERWGQGKKKDERKETV